MHAENGFAVKTPTQVPICYILQMLAKTQYLTTWGIYKMSVGNRFAMNVYSAHHASVCSESLLHRVSENGC